MRRAALVWFALGYGAFAAALAAALVVPGVPYNVREAVGGHGLAAPLLLPLVLSLLLGMPAAGAMSLGRGSRRAVILLSAAAALCGVVTYALLRITVPMESLGDIVGFPTLHWPWEWELLGRFVALFGAVWLLVAGGAVIGRAMRVGAETSPGPRETGPRLQPLIRWAAAALALLPVCYYVIVVRAGTDNLTELIAGGGTPLGAGCLALAMLILAAAASVAAASLAARLRIGRGGQGATHIPWGRPVLVIAGSFPVAQGLLVCPDWGGCLHVPPPKRDFTRRPYEFS